MVMEASPLLLPCDEEHAATAATRADAASAQASFLNLALGELTSLPPRAGEAPLLWSMLPLRSFVLVSRGDVLLWEATKFAECGNAVRRIDATSISGPPFTAARLRLQAILRSCRIILSIFPEIFLDDEG
jgi:hypothetical protein